MNKAVFLGLAAAIVAGCVAPTKPTAPDPVVAPSAAASTTPSAAPTLEASTPPAVVATSTPPPAKSAPVKFASDGSKKGVQGPFRLEKGLWTLKATHAGTGNFIVYLKPAAGGLGRAAFNEIGVGSWEWATLVEAAGDYYLDVQLADGAWSLTAN